MTWDSTHHPSEDALLSHALERSDEEIAAHLVGCAECSRVVGEIVAVKKDIEALPEESVPEGTRRRILGLSLRAGRGGRRLAVLRQNPVPALIGMAVIGATLLLYFLFVYVF